MERMALEIKTEERDLAGLEPGETGQGALPDKPCVKQEPEEGSSMNWDAQLQEFLRTLQAPHLSGESAPHHGPRLGSSPETRETATQTAPGAAKWPKGLWVSSDLVNFLGEAKQDPEEPLAAADEAKEEEGVLLGDAVWSERQCQRFRSLGYRDAEGPRELCRQLLERCRQWLKPERRTKEQILELVTLEQFLAILPLEMQSWVRKEGPKNCAQAVTLAEEFLLRQRKAKESEQQITGVLREAADPLPSDQAVPDAVETHLSLDAMQWAAERRNVFGHVQEGQRKERKSMSDSPEKADPQPRSFKEAKMAAITEEEDLIVVEDDGSRKENLSPRSLLVTPEDIKVEEKPYACRNCSQSFRASSDLLAHERTHVGDRVYKCSHCAGMVRLRKGQASCICSRCGNIFRSYLGADAEKPPKKGSDSGLSRSTRSERPPPQRTRRLARRFKCGKCGREFGQRSELLKHRATHEAEKLSPLEFLADRRIPWMQESHLCFVCEEGFRTQEMLEAHATTHSTGLVHKCSYCGKRYKYKGSLREHVLTHTPVWSCCGENFNQLSEFLLHESMHGRK